MKYKNCLTCGKKVSRSCRLGYCNKCRNRGGERNPFYGKKHDREMIETTKIKLSEILKQKWKDKEYRNKVIRGISKPRREGFKEEQSQRVKEWCKNNPNQRDIRSKIMKKSWADGKIEPNVNSVNESKLEQDLRDELIKRLPNREIKKSTIRVGKHWFYPDIRIDKNTLIEFYGDYWHANPKMFRPNDIIHHGLKAKCIWRNDEKRIKTLINSGFTVIVVWQEEYQNNKENIIRTIKDSL